MLERKPERVDHVVATGAHGVPAVLLQPLAHGTGRAAILARVRQARHIRRRWRGRRSQDVFQQPLSPDHRRRAGRIRRDRQDAGVTQQPSSRAIRIRHATEMHAVNTRDPVVLGKTLVDERVVRAQHVDNGAIVPKLVLEKQLRFLLHRITQVLVERNIGGRIRYQVPEAPQLQPLDRKVFDQRPRSGIGEHAPNLLIENGRIAELAPGREVQELIVRDAAPQEKGQARRQLEIADAICRAGPHAGWIGFDAKQKLWTHQDALDRCLNTGVEAPSGAAISVERHQRGDIGLRRRPPIRSTGERRENPPGTTLLVARAARGPAYEDLASAWQILGHSSVEGADNVDARDGRVAVLQFVFSIRGRRSVGRQRQNPFRQRRSPIEGDPDQVRSAFHRRADLEPLVGVQRIRLPFREGL